MNHLNKVIPLILCLSLAVTAMSGCGISSETSIVSDELYGKVISASQGTLNVELGILTNGFGMPGGGHDKNFQNNGKDMTPPEFGTPGASGDIPTAPDGMPGEPNSSDVIPDPGQRPDNPTEPMSGSDNADSDSKAPQESTGASGFVETDNQENSFGGGKDFSFGSGFSSCGITMKISVSSDAEYTDSEGNSITASDIKSGDIVKIEITENKASAITIVDVSADGQMLPGSNIASDGSKK